jgi:hypothetical protein
MTDTNGQPLRATLYHVTTGNVLESIQDQGIMPEYSVSKFKVSWFVTRVKVPWAILHVLSRHVALMDDIFVCPVLVEWDAMRNCGKEGVFYTQKTFKIEYPSPAIWFIQEMS